MSIGEPKAADPSRAQGVKVRGLSLLSHKETRCPRADGSLYLGHTGPAMQTPTRNRVRLAVVVISALIAGWPHRARSQEIIVDKLSRAQASVGRGVPADIRPAVVFRKRADSVVQGLLV